MGQSDHALRGTLAIVVVCGLWGTTGTAASFTAGVSPLATGAFAMGGAGILLVLSALKIIKREIPLLLRHPLLLLLGAAGVVLYPLSFYSAMNLAGVAIGNVVSLASAPFFSAIFERLFSKQKVSVNWLVSFSIGVCGILLLTLSRTGVETVQSQADHYVGIACGLLAGASYGLYAWVAKLLIARGISSKTAMATMFGLAAIVLLPSLSITGHNLFATPANALIALYMACVPMYIGYLAFGYGLRFISASKATLLTLLEPAIATALAVFVVGEQVSALGWLGIILIGLCMFLQMELHKHWGKRAKLSYTES